MCHSSTRFIWIPNNVILIDWFDQMKINLDDIRQMRNRALSIPDGSFRGNLKILYDLFKSNFYPDTLLKNIFNTFHININTLMDDILIKESSKNFVKPLRLHVSETRNFKTSYRLTAISSYWHSIRKCCGFGTV